ncbi:50S ribosomal protein L13 [Candidatus Pacearchaeota archaeon CG10_big_fil_rev_8_21_14_0_10_32_14]|nr:MAG: 50S ribosomal protein L13 [Candidatus Pacearchaeota archaeon CG10_big_fil_rev_8_21_14_0_10_32_14]
MKVIDGTNAIMGRLASYTAKQLLKGEEIAIVNVEKVIITGNKANIEKEFQETKEKVGSTQKGPKVSRSPERIVKRCIRGMLPNHREGRGKAALSRVKCYKGVPKQFEKEKMIKAGKEKGDKYIYVEQLGKK